MLSRVVSFFHEHGPGRSLLNLPGLIRDVERLCKSQILRANQPREALLSSTEALREYTERYRIRKMRGITIYVLLCSIAAAAPMPREKELTNSIGMRLVRIEPGAFLMGFEGRPIPADVAGKPWRVNGD